MINLVQLINTHKAANPTGVKQNDTLLTKHPEFSSQVSETCSLIDFISANTHCSRNI